MKNILIITMLLGIGHSQCNESNWQEYYNSKGHNMQGCYLYEADLQGANLSNSNIAVSTGNGFLYCSWSSGRITPEPKQ